MNWSFSNVMVAVCGTALVVSQLMGKNAISKEIRRLLWSMTFLIFSASITSDINGSLGPLSQTQLIVQVRQIFVSASTSVFVATTFTFAAFFVSAAAVWSRRA